MNECEEMSRRKKKRRKRKKTKPEKENETCKRDPLQSYQDLVAHVFRKEVIIVKKPDMGKRKQFDEISDMNGEITRGRKGRQPKLELQREYSDLTKKKHERIVKKLLDDFDLEETKEKYRGSQGEISYTPKSKGLADYQFRSDLRRLMGSDVIHLNDRQWNDKLHMKLQDEYQKQLDRKEEELALAETMRVRQLKIDGIISITEDDTVNQHDHVTKKRTGKAKGKRRKGNMSRRKRSASPNQQRTRCNSAPSRSVTFYKPPEDIPTQVEMMNKSRLEKDTSENTETTKSQSGVTQSEERVDSSSSPHRKTSFSSDDSSHHGSSKKAKHKKQPEEIRELYKEETVDGLYSMAERLVIISPKSNQKSVKEETSNTSYTNKLHGHKGGYAKRY